MNDAASADSPGNGPGAYLTAPSQSGAATPLRNIARSPADRLVADLFREHHVALVRVALLLVGDRATAEDVVQEAFVGLFGAAGRLTSPDKALPYLRASVVNGCRSVHRARSRALLRRVHHVSRFATTST
jgi:DNA-directed RNA polymerase specialized sigma24 family protein